MWTAGEMLVSPASATLTAELSPEHLRGRYQGVFALAVPLGAFAAPILGGLVQQTGGSTTLWATCAAVGLVGAAGQLASGPRRERRVARLRSARPHPGEVRSDSVGR